MSMPVTHFGKAWRFPLQVWCLAVQTDRQIYRTEVQTMQWARSLSGDIQVYEAATTDAKEGMNCPSVANIGKYEALQRHSYFEA